MLSITPEVKHLAELYMEVQMDVLFPPQTGTYFQNLVKQNSKPDFKLIALFYFVSQAKRKLAA